MKKATKARPATKKAKATKAKAKTSGRAKSTAGISDAAVQKATGMTWGQWLAALDRAGAKKMTHPQIVDVVHEKYAIGPWWRQMVTVGYEQARGLREKHEKPDGYQISRSKTIAAPASKLFNAWKDKKLRDLWLPETLSIHKATANKSMRATWGDGETTVEINFYPKGEGKTQVVVQHNKLADANQAERMKTYWAAALTRLDGAY